MTDPRQAPGSPGRGRRPLSREEQLKRGLTALPLLALLAVVIWALPLFAWWHAQVTDKHGTGARAFSAGDPFPWVLVVLGVLCVLGCLVAWLRMYARLRRLRREDRRPPA